MVSLNAYNFQQNNRISTLLESLRKKVKKYAVVDKQGQIIGEVKDLIVDANRQLGFVITKTVEREKNRCFELRSNLVQKIDSQSHRIFTNIDGSQIEELPEYIEIDNTISDMQENSINQEENTGNITSSAALATDKNSEILSVVQEENTGNITSSAALATDNNSEIPSVTTENIQTVEEEIIRLLGERLVVDRSKRKIGEVIVRKEIETRMIQVPVRHERLIVEQVSPERKQLAEIDLGLAEISDINLTDGEKVDFASVDSGLSVSGEFNSPKIASLLLNAIALERNNGCNKVRVTIVVEDEERQKTYQEWFERTSTDKHTHE